MAAQRLIHAVPVALSPADHMKFHRASILPGIFVQRFYGPKAREIERQRKTLPKPRDFVPTHLLVVDQNAYFDALDNRLHAEGKKRERGEVEFLDLKAVTRQALIAITLRGRLMWEVGGHHTFSHYDSDPPYITTGYSHGSTERVSHMFGWSSPPGRFADVKAPALRKTCTQLDCYYRSGTWWADRLSVALGYLWSALTTSHPELAFVALCMVLEAIATSAQNEVTHILAERCSILAGASLPERLLIYTQIKNLYSLRSKIVHGGSTPRKGPVTWEKLAITAKQSIIPRNDLLRMLVIVIDVINGVLRRPELLAILHTKQSEEKTSEAISVYFQSLLFK